MKTKAWKRTYKIGFSKKFGVKCTAGILKDEPLGIFDCPSQAYHKTLRHEVRDWENDRVTDVWFQTLSDDEVPVQLELFT